MRDPARGGEAVGGGLDEQERGQLVGHDFITQSLGSALRYGGSGLRNVPGLAKRLLRSGGWRRRVLERTGQLVEFDSFPAFVAAAPLDGLGGDLAMLRNLCRDDVEALALIDEACQGRDGNPTGANQHKGGTVNNVNGSTRPLGNSRDAALRRLRKDRPDLLARVTAGELTPHRAMVEAGFRRVPTALEQVRKAWRAATDEERQAIAEWVAGEAPRRTVEEG